MTDFNTNDPKIQRIINAALKEFSLRGYDEASTNRIAKAAGLSKPLMFHYVKSKEDLFWLLVDYCQKTIDEDYLKQMDFQEKDLFKRLRQSYVLQIELMKKNPWIIDFSNKTFGSKSETINAKLTDRSKQDCFHCKNPLFEQIDESKFRSELTVDQYKQLIYWGNIGFTTEVLAELKNAKYEAIDYQEITDKLIQYLENLSRIFYR